VSVLKDSKVLDAIWQAWRDSVPGTADAHEEGGFVLRDSDGSLSVERWPRGVQDRIEVPPHPGGRVGEKVIAASFHTHPNPPPDYQQEPSLMDIRAVRDDPNLGHPEYDGELVISQEMTYRIKPDGTVEELGASAWLFLAVARIRLRT